VVRRREGERGARRLTDAVVIGLGAVGSAATWQLARRGAKVIGIDRHSPPHAMGSSHGDTRITRLAIGEGPQYTPLAMRSHEIWRDIESRTGEDLLVQTGMLVISSDRRRGQMHGANFYANTLEAARRYSIAHEELDAAAIRRRFPCFRVTEGEVGYYEREAGYLRPEACVATQLRLAEEHGATLRRNETVTRVESRGDGVRVHTDHGTFDAGHAIIAAGAWVRDLVPAETARHFTVTRQLLFWFDVEPPVARFMAPDFPVWIWELQGRQQAIYGFPAIDGPHRGMKIATEQYAESTTAQDADRSVDPAEAGRMLGDLVAPHLSGVGTRGCLKAIACLYTGTPDFQFVVDRHPEVPAALVVSACSGHGFKHSAALGESIAERILDGASRIDLSGFSLARF
jgi:sarcosine oxidase